MHRRRWQWCEWRARGEGEEKMVEAAPRKAIARFHGKRAQRAFGERRRMAVSERLQTPESSARSLIWSTSRAGNWTEPISRTTGAPTRTGEEIVQARSSRCHETGEAERRDRRLRCLCPQRQAGSMACSLRDLRHGGDASTRRTGRPSRMPSAERGRLHGGQGYCPARQRAGIERRPPRPRAPPVSQVAVGVRSICIVPADRYAHSIRNRTRKARWTQAFGRHGTMTTCGTSRPTMR